uniref:FAD-dependent oxidoreductase domain containing 2 n=1 Tax=Astyanax mexicanus TaxID=7994 RepID=A0A8B9H1D3_ASTMX
MHIFRNYVGLKFNLLVLDVSGEHHGINNTHHHDYCVLGAGPAGLQMGYFLSRSHRDYIILERNTGPGSFFQRYPRHRKLISINKIYTGRQNKEFNLRHDWNSLLSDQPDLLFQRVSEDLYPHADAYPLYLSMFERELGLRVKYATDIGKVRAADFTGSKGYILTDQHGADYKCRVLFVCTGLWVPQQVDFVGSDLVEGYESIPTDPEDYKNQAVLILGKGNSAFETAQSILGRASRIHMYSPSPVRLAWKTHYVGDLRAVNNELLDTYQLKSLDGLVEGGLEDIAIVRRGQDGGKSRRTGGKKRTVKSTERKEQFYLTLSELLDNRNSNKSGNITAENLPGYHDDNFSLRQPYDRVIRCLGFRFNFSIYDGYKYFTAAYMWICYVKKHTPPLFCQQGYLNKQGFVGNSHLWQHAREAGLMPAHQGSVTPAGDGTFSEFLTHAGAAVTSTINFDL